MVVGQTGGYTVVEDHAVFLAHQAVAGLAHVQLGPGVGVDAVEELSRIRALNVDLAQGGGVEDAHRVTHGQALTGHGGVHVFTVFREVPGALPLADVFELGTVFQVPFLHGGVALGLEQLATVTAGDGAEGHRGVVRAEHGGAHLGDADTDGAGSDGQTVDVAQLALIGTEAQRGVALDVLDRLEALAGGQLDTGGGDVVLLVDELLRRTRSAFVVRHLEQCNGGFFDAFLGLRHATGNGVEAHFGSSLGTGFETIGQGVAQTEDAVYRTGAMTFLEAFTRNERQDVFAPDGTAAQVRSQVHDRTVAAGAGDQVALDHFARAGDLVLGQIDGADARTGDALAAARFDHGTAGEDAHATAARFFDPAASRIAAGIGHGDHLATGVEPIEHHAVGVIVVGRQHQLLARCDAIAAHIGGDGIGQHVAGYVVVGINQRTLMGASGQYNTTGTYTVQTLTRLAHGRHFAEVVGEALVNGEEVVVVVTVDRGTRQQGHFRHALQLGDGLGSPVGGRLVVEHLAGGEQAAAELFLFVGEDHPCTTATGSQGCGETGRAGTDHQHVAVLVQVVVDVRIVFLRRATETGSLTNVLLVGQPQVLRVHEGLVVEAGRHHATADLAKNAHHVGVDARPAVGAGSGQPLVQRLLGGAHVGDLRSFGGTDLQHGIGFFGASGDDAARTRVLEAAADHVDAIGQQGGGQGVTGITLVGLAVEAESQGLAAVDAATLGKTIDLAHAVTPWSTAFFAATLASVTLGRSPIL